MLLKQNLESSLNSKEIKPVNPKGKQTLNIHWKDWCWSWSSSTLATSCKQPTHWKGPWCWERLRAGGEVGDRGWSGWMASVTQWTRIWAYSGRLWRTGKPGVLHSTGSQRVGHDWVTEQQQKHSSVKLARKLRNASKVEIIISTPSILEILMKWESFGSCKMLYKQWW